MRFGASLPSPPARCMVESPFEMGNRFQALGLQSLDGSPGKLQAKVRGRGGEVGRVSETDVYVVGIDGLY